MVLNGGHGGILGGANWANRAMTTTAKSQVNVAIDEVGTSNNTYQMLSLTQAKIDKLMSLLGMSSSKNMIHDALYGKKFSCTCPFGLLVHHTMCQTTLKYLRMFEKLEMVKELLFLMGIL